MDPASIFKIITNSTWIVTQLLGDSLFKFPKPIYRLNLNESVSPGPLLQLNVKAISKDLRIKYQLISGNNEGVFNLDTDTGLLSLVKNLDYELEQLYRLLVWARFQEEISEATVDVQVHDENDHKPKFLRELHETQITEEDDRHLPKVIMKVIATDGDAGEFGKLKYFLSDNKIGEDILACFSVVEESGDILLLKPLDRDPPTGRSKWHFEVIATDGQYEATTTVIVNVKDVNDNPPKFYKQLVEAYISENRPEGTLVSTVKAVDNDDKKEGSNAQIVYSLEKNVIDESTGRPIFSIDNLTGRIETALCCLDREKTDSYTIQVVATDGGGLKGTGTVSVRVSDENDVAPKFTRNEWSFEVEEGILADETIVFLGVIDPDITNDFEYSIIPSSGNGWQLFYLMSQPNNGADLKAKIALDYENPKHREGFQFQVKVSDMGTYGWSSNLHTDTAWVRLQLIDINDNTPKFLQNSYYKKVFENISTGTALLKVEALDADEKGVGDIHYSVAKSTDPNHIFKVDDKGVLRLWKNLDRETSARHNIQILAKDTGHPQRTATATVVVDVEDVNDNAPHLTSPRIIRVLEESPPQPLCELVLSDADDWRKRHGPPFNLILDPKADQTIKDSIYVEFNSRSNHGVGKGVLKSKVPLDREKHKMLFVPLISTDSGRNRQSATLTMTVMLDDINDNKMKPGSKIVEVRLVKSSVAPSLVSLDGPTVRVPLGRVFVKDLDDWDSHQKSFRFVKTNDFFHAKDGGFIMMEPWIPSGSYHLQFLVSDRAHKQYNVPANVTVNVQVIDRNILESALPVVLSDDPKDLLKHHKNGKNKLYYFENALQNLVAKSTHAPASHDFQIVSVQTIRPERPYGKISNITDYSRLWISSPPLLNLRQIILLKWKEIEFAAGVHIASIGSKNCNEISNCSSGCWTQTEIGRGFALVDSNTTSLVGPDLYVTSGCGCSPPMPVVNDDPFSPRPVIKESTKNSCDNNPCLNGGHCIQKSSGYRCICPYGTHGRNCKIRERKFHGQTYKTSIEDEGGGDDEVTSWAWVSSLPSCAYVHVSLEFMTEEETCIIMAEGPISKITESLHLPINNPTLNYYSADRNSTKKTSKQSNLVVPKNLYVSPNSLEQFINKNYSIWHKIRHQKHNVKKIASTAFLQRPTTKKLFHVDSTRPNLVNQENEDYIFLYLSDGYPNLVINLGGGPLLISLNTTHTLADNQWHRIDIVWQGKTVEMAVDLCLGTSLELNQNSSSTIENCRVKAKLPNGGTMFNSKGPLQIGGVASMSFDGKSVHLPSLKGCIRNLRVNRELQDLGHDILSSNSRPGCDNDKCMEKMSSCSFNGECVKQNQLELCNCDLGFQGINCARRTPSFTFRLNSFTTAAISFPLPVDFTKIQLRFRSYGNSGSLVHLSSSLNKSSLTIELIDSYLCYSLVSVGRPPNQICLAKITVNDGIWHKVQGIRVGSTLMLSMDDGDSYYYNVTLGLDHWPTIKLTQQDGLHIGGIPVYKDGELLKIGKDFNAGCIEDVRVQNYPISLLNGSNNTQWSQTTAAQNITEGCIGPPICSNVTCHYPLSCIDTFGSYHCGCEVGTTLSYDADSCEDINECKWNPCLNNGYCINRMPGYDCECPVGIIGENCHIRQGTLKEVVFPTALLVFISIGFLVLILCIILGASYLIRRRIKFIQTNNDLTETQIEVSPETSSNNRKSPKATKTKGDSTAGVDSDSKSCKKCGNAEPESISMYRLDGIQRCSQLEVINTYQEDL